MVCHHDSKQWVRNWSVSGHSQTVRGHSQTEFLGGEILDRGNDWCMSNKIGSTVARCWRVRAPRFSRRSINRFGGAMVGSISVREKETCGWGGLGRQSRTISRND